MVNKCVSMGRPPSVRGDLVLAVMAWQLGEVDRRACGVTMYLCMRTQVFRGRPPCVFVDGSP